VPSIESPKSIAANVNGEPITIEEVDAALSSSLPGTPLTPSQKRDLRRAVLEDLIDEKLLRQFLAKNAAKVETAEIDAHYAAFNASLIKENSPPEEFFRRTKQKEAQFRDELSARIHLTHYAKQLATDEKLKAFHEKHRDHFDKVEVRVSHIQIRAGQDASPVDRAAAKEKLQRIRTEISSGRLPFPSAARKYSQCPSALKNGDLGFISRRGLPEDEPLARAAFALSVGGPSEVIETNRGLHLVTVTDRKSGTPSVLEKCVSEVFEAFVEEMRVELVKKLRGENSVRIMLP
jgi:parvulin-like peptidyl-prolyl isomerase